MTTLFLAAGNPPIANRWEFEGNNWLPATWHAPCDRFSEHSGCSVVRREVLSRSQRASRLRRQSTNQGSVGSWTGCPKKGPPNASQVFISVRGRFWSPDGIFGS